MLADFLTMHERTNRPCDDIGYAFVGDGRFNMGRSLLVTGTPDSTIPNQKVDTGGEAKAFAAVISKHTLAATDGQTYSQMARFLDASGKPVQDESAAAKDPKTSRPVENPKRDIWIASTAFQTALNTAYFAESIATFVAVIGVALLLVGIGFLILTIRLLVPAPHKVAREEPQQAVPVGV